MAHNDCVSMRFTTKTKRRLDITRSVSGLVRCLWHTKARAKKKDKSGRCVKLVFQMPFTLSKFDETLVVLYILH